eukprot:NODE_933_length_1132_cov_295.507849_g646_i0.p1 GENE.NODE_933_length_1132_cov_295.507849_g646_i0~~NODE_933_length_1132_cov_295.507849_g646_i0.p1  ORF type:complete len:187 (-),score=29.37 NODE_933_length_1132_cov_295.507849_g646_i0:423-983(-)
MWMHDVFRVGMSLGIHEVGGKFGLFFPNKALTVTHGAALLLAAGVGITPFVSMLRGLFAMPSTPSATGVPTPTPPAGRLDVHLIHSDKSVEELPFREEIEGYARSDSAAGGHTLQVHYTLTGNELPSIWAGNTGRITLDMIREVVPDFASRTVFICGPTSFAVSLTQQLTLNGVPQAHIFEEAFDF